MYDDLNENEQAGSSARELIVRGRHKKPVITFCREIDGMLGGGVPRGELTEVKHKNTYGAVSPAKVQKPNHGDECDVFFACLAVA